MPIERTKALPPLRNLGCRAEEADGEPGHVLWCPLGLCEPAFLTQAAAVAASCFDGRADAAEVAAEVSANFPWRMTARDVLQLAAELDERLLLASPRFFLAAQAECDRWLAGGIRHAAHAGSAGYSADPEILRRDLDAMIRAPRRTPPTACAGLAAPHLDLRRGRLGYGAAYSRLLQTGPRPLYLVLGTGHHGPSRPVTGLPLDWSTPLGTACADRAFVDAVHARIGAPGPADLLLHKTEHSIEFQVVMLQRVHELLGAAPPRIAAFLCGALPAADGDPTKEEWLVRLLAAFAEARAASHEDACVIVGADLAHIGPEFGAEQRLRPDRLVALERDDRRRLGPLLRGEPGAFHQAVLADGNRDEVCSAAALTLGSLLCDGPAELLRYGQAAAQDGSSCVSYCSLAFSTRQDRRR